jgi:hypothetical protein
MTQHMTTNNFKQLQEEQERKAPPLPLHIKENVGRSVELLRFWGEVADLYVGKALNVMSAIASGKAVESDEKEE